MLHSSASVRRLLAVALILAAWPLLAGIGSRPQDTKPAAESMPTWHVLFGTGPKYDPQTPIKAQTGFLEHLMYVQKLAGEGTLLLGGPLLESPESGTLAGAVMVVRAKDEKAVRDLLATDVFVKGEMLKIESVRPFVIGAGAWIPKATAGASGAK